MYEQEKEVCYTLKELLELSNLYRLKSRECILREPHLIGPGSLKEEEEPSEIEISSSLHTHRGKAMWGHSEKTAIYQLGRVLTRNQSC